jgi:hypothetical protein
MEEHTCLETHLAKMHRIQTNDLANSVVLRPLPPSYKSFVDGFVIEVAIHGKGQERQGGARRGWNRRSKRYMWYTKS